METVSLIFIILHYAVLEDTLACVRSIRERTRSVSYQILVVDNASPDETGKALDQEFGGAQDTVVLHNEENLGFARGNNRGIDYAKAHYRFEYCVICNNDTVLLDDDFYQKLQSTYAETGFAVLGPMMLTAKGRCDGNPVHQGIRDTAYVDDCLRNARRDLFFESHPALWQVRRVGRKIKREVMSRILPSLPPDPSFFTNLQTDVELHGFFLVFSSKYFQYFPGFYDKTFFYYEEPILHLLVHRVGLLTVYQPAIHVFHREGSSTEASLPVRRKRRIHRLLNSISSLEILKNLLEEEDSSPVS